MVRHVFSPERQVLLAVLLIFAVVIPAGATGQPPKHGATVSPKLAVAFFYSPTCAYCKEAKAALATCEKRYRPRIKVERYNVAKLENFVAMFPYEDHYGSKETEPPKVFIGRQYIAGGKKIEKQLSKVVAQELAAGSPDPPPVCAENRLT